MSSCTSSSWPVGSCFTSKSGLSWTLSLWSGS
ncbi:rCG34938, isoform CRA_b [Rattus norvegicus]|uniref:RCG34938, isoform CRA_b n=1 Tax=Rattus norvegicus TaxID=10116 RepID=A6HGF0_RAT|nr:rCG34938, isoform CRA_b [Rattus norvegicus]